MTLLAAFQTLLYRYTQQEDIVVGSAIANRNRGEIEGLIGFFVNSLVLRSDLSGNPTFLELLDRVREVALGAYAHQDLPFEKLVEELHPERNLSHHPLFQVVFSLQNTPIEALALPGLSLSPLDFDRPSAKFDLEFHLWESPEGLRGQVIYSSDLWDDTTITRMLGHFQMLLQGIIVNPQQRLCELPILTQAEQHQLLVDFNPNPSKIKSCFHQLFEQQVEQTPDAIALVFEDEQLTYRELNHRSNQLSHHLQKLGVEAEVLVGICLERSVEMIVGVLGILKAGGAYVPLEPTYPEERLNFMLEDSQVFMLLTHSALAPLFKGSFSGEGWGNRTKCSDRQHGLSVVCVDKEADAIKKESQENPTNCVTADHLAYVIYTSGSTGKPKGVLIEHRGLCNLSEAQIQTFNLQPSNRILQFASLSFDASIFEIVMALATGSTLYLAQKESILPGQNLSHLLRDKAITHVTLPPSVLAVLPAPELPALQTIISAGEACSMDIVKCWASNRQFFNAYGPTEATVWSTVAELTDDSEKPSIGRPIANTQVYILDSHLKPVPIGISGELYIGGEGVARGYLNQPELTAVAFISNPFVDSDSRFSASERLYKTGDLARYQPDGNIEFLGRIDQQVKIRGFRIELGEIEARLKQHPVVKEAVVMAKEDVSGNKRLVTYIVPNQEQLMRVGAQGFAPLLRCFLKEKLPEYMIPSAFVMLDALPHLPNGKVDRRNLKVLDVDKTELTENYMAPRTPIEEAIAKIWAKILNYERVGIQDNFFELGGDSLLAVRLMAQIHQQFEREIPLSSLFLNPTVEGLAKILAQQTDSLSWSPLVPIQPSGSKPPFFCVHPILGVVFPYYELAYSLGFDQPFYGLQPLGLDGKQSPFTRIEEMAAHYIEALRQVQPSGPYFLGGWSFGGLVAFEMAQQLLSAGHQVALLAIFDTLAPIPGNLPNFGDSLKFMFTAAARYIWSFLLDYFYLITTPNQPQANHLPFHLANINKLLHRLRNKQFWQSILGEAVLANTLPQSSRKQILSELNIRPMLRIYQANSQATLSYVPQVYPNSITLLKTSVQSSMADQDSSLGWSQLAGGKVEIHQVPGNHLTMLRKPHVKILANQLKVCIEQARIANINSL
jgi:amino acid adenylation domain-containing protein